MSGPGACRDQGHKPMWRVVQYKSNRSAFNGYHRTASDYSAVTCLTCTARWRTKAAYVRDLVHDWGFWTTNQAGRVPEAASPHPPG